MTGPRISRRGLFDLAAGATASAVVSNGFGGSSASAHDRADRRDAAKPGARPNIVLFMPDELRADALGCYGNPVSRTPSFDALAASGTMFANCHVQFPVCTQSRCSIMTGWPGNARGHRSLYYPLQRDEPNLFRYLREAGYDTYFFGKNDLLSTNAFADSITRWSDAPATYAGYRPHPVAEAPEATTFLYDPLSDDPRATWDYGLLARAIEVLEMREHDRPFCIFLPIFQPHPPYAAPRSFHEMFSAADIPPLAPPGLADKPAFHEGIREKYGLGPVTEATFRRIRAVYYGQVAYTDWLLGELLEAMERTGRAKDTALFVLSDHGDYAGDYGLVEKWSSGLEDVLTQIPLITRVPGGAARHRVDEMVEAYDVMATCIELAGTNTRHTHFAQSLTPQLSGSCGNANRAAFSSAGFNANEPQAFEKAEEVPGVYKPKADLQIERPDMVTRAESIRTQTHKLILRPGGVSELYDCSADPMLTRNVYGDASHEDVREALEDRLRDRLIETSGILPAERTERGIPPYPSTAE